MRGGARIGFEREYRRGDGALLTVFGSIAVASMLISYGLENRSAWFVLTFAVASAATAVYSGLEEVWPITVIEALWSMVALQRFAVRWRVEGRLTPFGKRT